ncbi:DUF262 domain-containing protein [Citrobacter freundii]|uniref:DUF262 domain-containing protein n=1 Tax=Citrobacter freundii TaxID=546 RepID=UPI00109389F4|nr:DUF262 domain-containing protein [Citrobacter freundii]QCA17603.1 DUF262 domain-containing protein [Citrobacter freundii]
MSVESKSVQNLFAMYRNGEFIVNRRYQRKLVWLMEEKEKFINSLLNNYPIPMVLTSRLIDMENNGYEILDGLQRLNSITSFIENEFSVGGKYFDLSSTAQTLELLNNGLVQQKMPKLSIEECSQLLNYPIPISVTQYKDSSFIDETFRRINTGGRKLSKHDIRQAGALGEFPALVSELASFVRRDKSKTNLINLAKIKSISISNKKMNYGININDVFWVKNGIINHENIRCSRDEELIAYILSYVLDKDNSSTSAVYLDKLYDADSNESASLTTKINAYGAEELNNRIKHIFNQIEKVFNHNGRTPFNQHCYKGKALNSAITFQIVFLAFYELMINQNMDISNYKNIHDALHHCYDTHFSTVLGENRKWSNKDRKSLISALSGVLVQHMKKAGEEKFPHGKKVESLENILNESAVEQVYYDFKAGLVQTSPPQNYINQKTLSKIVKTLTAMINTYDLECSVIVGVAESKEGAENHKAAYGHNYIKYNNFYIVGIRDEAIKSHKSIDAYINKIIALIKDEPISDEMKRQIIEKIKPFDYNGKEVLIFNAIRTKKPESYDKGLYIREASSLAQVETGTVEFYSLLDKFK